MDENNKLFVFEKKEVLLIFVFVILIAVIAFTLGVRVGKGLSLKNDGFIPEDTKTIDLKSVDEEYVESVVKADDLLGADDDSVNSNETSQNEIEKRLKLEMEKLATTKVEIPDNNIDSTPEVSTKDVKESVGYRPEASSNNDFSGKYTIQLYSNQSKEVAQDFADGFIAKGYDVIVNEVSIPGKGVWYRVSIGIFESMNEAKGYLQKEKNLFQENKYIIQQF